MSNLPRVTSNKYDLPIEELNKTVKYRPFTVGEHKILLQAIEMKDEPGLVNTIKDIVNACTFNQLDLERLPVHIVDYLYLKIHARSSGSSQIANYTCNNMVLQPDETFKRCDGKFSLKIDLDAAKIVYPTNYKDRQLIMVNDTVGIKMRVPSFEDFKKIKLDSPVLDIADHFIFSCIDSIFSGDSVQTPGVDFTLEETVEWLNDLDGNVMEKISDFFKEMPYLGLSLPVTCPICGKKEVIELQGLEDFFA